LRWVRHSESDPIDLLICGSKKTTKNLPKRNGEGGGRCLGTPHPSRVGRVSALFRPTHRHPPPISWAETPTPSQQPAAPACLPPSPAARFPTRLLHQPNLVIRETIPTLNIQSDERDCPGLRVGPAHVVAHRLSLP